MSPTAQPHDRFFRRMLSRRETAIDLVREYVPAEIVSVLALDSLEVTRGSYVDAELRVHLTDLVYRVDLAGGGEARVYLLLEHKSAPDGLVALQLLRYLTHLWEHHLRQEPGLPLPAVLPMVFYHGTRPWSVPTEFSDLLRCPEPLAPFVPRFRYLLVDLSRLRDEEIRGQELLRTTFLAMLHVFDDDLKPRALRLLEELRPVASTEAGKEAVVALLHYFGNARDRADRSDLLDAVGEAFPGPEGDRIMVTIADEWIQEGIRQSIEQVLEARFQGVPGPVRERLGRIEDIRALQEVLRTAATAESLEAFGQVLESFGASSSR
jgi:predicted transposase/invertase (TIGR01784 family)